MDQLNKPEGNRRVAWEEVASTAVTSLQAPNGSAVRRQSFAPAGGQTGYIYTQLMRVPSCHYRCLSVYYPYPALPRRDSSKKNKDLENQINFLNTQLDAKDGEVNQLLVRLQLADNAQLAKEDQLCAAKAEQDKLLQEIKKLQAVVTEHERREQLAAEKEAAERAANGPPPPLPAEVQRELLQSFDEAALMLCKEAAFKAGVAEADFCVGQAGFDSAAMVEAGLSMAQIAEQYLRAAMERAVSAVEPARLEAVRKWQNERKHRQQLQDQLQELKGSIRVLCRMRPATTSEGAAVANVTSDTTLSLSQPGKDDRKNFTFDHVFGSACDQASVFEEVEPVIHSVLNGFNTGSGKTFTMEGVREAGGHSIGINPRAVKHLFELIAERRQLSAMSSEASDGWTYEVAVSYLEIYNENLRDLLAPPTKDKKVAALEVRSAPGAPVSVPNLTTITVDSAEEVQSALQRGASRRSVAATKMNSTSSRSHSIVMVTVVGRQAGTGASTHGKLHLVDLAGSERVKKSEVTGQGMTEAQNINKSLSALGDVMAALQEKSKHIPFRNSKLTQLLADSLGGNSKTFMFVNISPAEAAASETLCSLNFASRVRRVEMGKASSRRVEGASLQDLNAAQSAAERASQESNALRQRLTELEREVALSRDAHASIEAELQRERHRATEYRETEEFIRAQGQQRQQLEIDEEKKRIAALETRLKETTSKLAASEKLAQGYAAELAARPIAPSPDRKATAEETMQALAALRQAASERLNGVIPRLNTSGSTEAAASSTQQMAAPPAHPAVPEAFEGSREDLASCAALDLMDAPICFTGSTVPHLMPVRPPPHSTPLLDEVGAAAAPASGKKSRSPEAAFGNMPVGTPTRVEPGTTPAKLSRPDGVDSVKSARKVHFKFSSGKNENGAEGGVSLFPTFALPFEKENETYVPPTPTGGSSARGLRKPVSSMNSVFNSAINATSMQGKREASKSSFSFDPVPAPIQTSLGGASRVLVGGKAARGPRQSLSGGNGIVKRSRRSSISSLVGVPESAIKRYSRPAWQ
ncbi:hypothetical protein AB1Y20_009161 [Prymnesium parvum]|uniref:Kinesin motor domain-containing protein n=1 Tax=Prymnesium parvum TaxID=97485 RepID=A0AB34K460_PRYPA